MDTNCICKFLGTPFGLNMTTHDMDSFLKEKLDKKLQYWCTTKNNSIGRGVIVNGILLSTLTYFAVVWSGIQTGLLKISAVVHH